MMMGTWSLLAFAHGCGPRIVAADLDRAEVIKTGTVKQHPVDVPPLVGIERVVERRPTGYADLFAEVGVVGAHESEVSPQGMSSCQPSVVNGAARLMADIQISSHNHVAGGQLIGPCCQGGENLVLAPPPITSRTRIALDSENRQLMTRAGCNGEAPFAKTGVKRVQWFATDDGKGLLPVAFRHPVERSVKRDRSGAGLARVVSQSTATVAPASSRAFHFAMLPERQFQIASLTMQPKRR